MSIDSPHAASRGSPETHGARQRVIAYLCRHHTISLATDGPSGLWAATVFYVSIGFDLYFRSKASSRHIRNLTANPRIAGTINDDVEDWRAIKGIQLEGRVDVIVGESSRQIMELFSLRYPFVEDLWGDEEDKRIAFRITTERLVFHDHEESQNICELVGSQLTDT